MQNRIEKEIIRSKEELKKEIEQIIGKKEFENFEKFAFRDKLTDVATAFILGAAFKKLVTSISENLIMPVINFALSQTGSDWRTGSYSPIKGITFETGKFLGDSIDFMLTAVILYILYYKIFKKVAPEKPTEEPKKITCPQCLNSIQLHCKRCPFCTSWIKNK